MDLADLRLIYARAGLLESEVSRDALVQFKTWFDQALAANLEEPNAMTLATASPDGVPNARMVLLKGIDASGFVFFTNYSSRKGREIEVNNRAALLFYWPDLERQVRVNGIVEKLGRAQSEAYFRSRPRGHQLGAWASKQSEIVADRAAIESNMTEAEARFAGVEVPLPPFWGGYRVVPAVIEFWQGRPNRLHDRLEYIRMRDGGWKIQRLSP